MLLFSRRKQKPLNKIPHKSVKVTCPVTTFSPSFYLHGKKKLKLKTEACNKIFILCVHENDDYRDGEFTGELSVGEIPAANNIINR